jgi:hypothetical protein
MSNYAYEMLGRATWVVGKRVARKKAHEFVETGKSRRPNRAVGLLALLILVVGGIAAAEVAARQTRV